MLRVPPWMLLTGILALVLPGSARAFDGARKGFALGGGAGLGVNSFSQEVSGGGTTLASGRESNSAFVTDFKIGGGVSENLLLYFHNCVTWFDLKNTFGSDVTIASGVTGFGATWYPGQKPGKVFLTGTLGASFWDTPFESSSSAWRGLGAMAGVGYEFSRHWSAQASVMFGNPDTSEGGLSAQTNTTALVVTIAGLAY